MTTANGFEWSDEPVAVYDASQFLHGLHHTATTLQRCTRTDGPYWTDAAFIHRGADGNTYVELPNPGRSDPPWVAYPLPDDWTREAVETLLRLVGSRPSAKGD